MKNDYHKISFFQYWKNIANFSNPKRTYQPHEEHIVEQSTSI